MLQGITDADAKRAIEAVVAGIGELEEPVAIAEAAFGLYYERRPVPLSSSFPTLGKLIPKAKLKKDKPS